MRRDRRCDANRFAKQQTLRVSRSVAGVENHIRGRDCLFYRPRCCAARASPRHHQCLSTIAFTCAFIAKINILMFDFLKRNQLIRRGLASRKTRRRRTRNELLRSLEYSIYIKILVFAGFVAGLAFLVFSGQQPEPTKNFFIALLIFATALIQLWINQPKTFSRTSLLFLVFGIILLQMGVTKLLLVLCNSGNYRF